LLKKGLENGVIAAGVIRWDVPQQVKSQLEEDPAKNPMRGRLRIFPAGIRQQNRAVTAGGIFVVTNAVIPAIP